MEFFQTRERRLIPGVIFVAACYAIWKAPEKQLAMEYSLKLNTEEEGEAEKIVLHLNPIAATVQLRPGETNTQTGIA
ncbi:unnamed protein product [Cuscuta campestris]|uniref:Uncharacterized protein n=1 Tax=Cuscuta campestris TaxID=132261 RepID=A0A484N2E4_9ASTE|nr:unnamed protein product [Cuscuta campestris]